MSYKRVKMRRMFLGLLMGFLATAAAADVLEDVQSAFRQRSIEAQNVRHPSGQTVTVIRGYLATKGGMLAISGATSPLSQLASRAVVQSTLRQIGYPLIFAVGNGNLEIYQAPRQSTDATGTLVLVYYDAAGNGSEIYAINDTLP